MIKAGDIVTYHSIIGGPPTSYGHRVESVEMLESGHKVAWITGKSGCVSVDALSSPVWYCCNEEFGKHKANCMNFKQVEGGAR